MNLPKAIEILHDLIFVTGSNPDPDIPDAIKLGAEALKHELAARASAPHLPWQPLPGED